jgi:hypothetical protein
MNHPCNIGNDCFVPEWHRLSQIGHRPLKGLSRRGKEKSEKCNEDEKSRDATDKGVSGHASAKKNRQISIELPVEIDHPTPEETQDS